MLTHLSIKNLAIIENIDVSFKEGFNVLTGATGAGKSLVIDSLSLLLGARASTELIRTVAYHRTRHLQEQKRIQGQWSHHFPK